MHRVSLRRWFSFRLRSLFIIVTLLAIGVGWVARERNQSRRELELIMSFGGQAWSVDFVGPYDAPIPRSTVSQYLRTTTPSLWQLALKSVLGPRVSSFYLVAPAGSDLSPLAQFSRLRMLSLHADPGTNLAPLARLTHLESLSMIAPAVSDFTVLAELKNLCVLDLDGTKISDLSPLAGLSRLEELRIQGTPVRDLSPLLRMASLRELKLSEPFVTNTAMQPASAIEDLRRLALENPDIDYSALIETAEQEPAAREAADQQSQSDQLRRTLPKCRINSGF